MTKQDALHAPCCVTGGVCIVTHLRMTARLLRHEGREVAGTAAAPPHAGTQVPHGSG